MFEKVNPSHPDKMADRIAGAIVDMAYRRSEAPRIAVEVLLGHGSCTIIAETSESLEKAEIKAVAKRIAGEGTIVHYSEHPQDQKLAGNQECSVRCGDNGIFKGMPVTEEQCRLSGIAREIYDLWPYDGKYIIDGKKLVICQSRMPEGSCNDYCKQGYDVTENPLGYWTGGPDVDAGATNRKLGSDMADGVTGGGLHGKDLSKADVSVNIACHVLAQMEGQGCFASCAIGDEDVTFRFEWIESVTMPYTEVVEMARGYVKGRGGFEKLAEWGLV